MWRKTRVPAGGESRCVASPECCKVRRFTYLTGGSMYSFDSRVRYSECDENGVLALVPMMNYLQDLSLIHI